MKSRLFAILLSVAASMAATSAFAADPPNFDFFGYAVIPSSVGGTLTLRSILTNNGVVPTPIPLDFTTKQFTIVVTGTLGAGSPQPYTGTVDLWSQDILGGTPADYGTPSTFTDGVLILAGTFDGSLLRSTYTPTLGGFIGKVNWSGGSRLGELTVVRGWPFGGGWSRRISGIPTGYNEAWDGKIDFNAVGVESKTWNSVKEFYR